MPSADSIALAAQLSLIQSVDDKRSPEDPHRLAPWLRSQLDVDLEEIQASDSETVASSVDQSGKTALVRRVVERMESLLRDGYNGITAIRRTAITEEDRATVYAAYGWSGGLLGRFFTSRTVGLARIAVREHPEVLAKYRYSPELIADLQLALAEYSDIAPESVDGSHGETVESRAARLQAAEETLSQVRYAYCMASRNTVKNPELLKIGFRPRRPQRTKEEIQSAEQRREAKRQEDEAKRLQRIDEREQRKVARLTEELDRTRRKAVRDRGQVGNAPVRPNSPDSMPQADGDVPLSN